jgi:hypothetical protein
VFHSNFPTIINNALVLLSHCSSGIPAEAKPQNGHFLLPARFKGRVNGKSVKEEMAKEDVAAFMIQEALAPTFHNRAVTICEPQDGADPLVLP